MALLAGKACFLFTFVSMRLPRILILLTGLVFSLAGTAQNIENDSWKTYGEKGSSQKERTDSLPSRIDTTLPPGKITVHQDPRIDSLVASYQKMNEENPGIRGYRVQVFFGERKIAREKKADLLESYPDAKAYISYLAPNFRVRVGNYRTRLKALEALEILRSDFPGAYVVKDRIELPELGKPPLKEGELRRKSE